TSRLAKTSGLGGSRRVDALRPAAPVDVGGAASEQSLSTHEISGCSVGMEQPIAGRAAPQQQRQPNRSGPTIPSADAGVSPHCWIMFVIHRENVYCNIEYYQCLNTYCKNRTKEVQKSLGHRTVRLRGAPRGKVSWRRTHYGLLRTVQWTNPRLWMQRFHRSSALSARVRLC